MCAYAIVFALDALTEAQLTAADAAKSSSTSLINVINAALVGLPFSPSC